MAWLALALAALLANPLLLALPPPPGAMATAPPLLPLTLHDAGGPSELVVGVPAVLGVRVRSEGLGGSGVQPPAERGVRVLASADSGDAVAADPAWVVLGPGSGDGWTTLRFTPTRLGPLALHAHARWELVGNPAGAEAALAPHVGEATLDLARAVVKDTLAVQGLEAAAPDAELDLSLHATFASGHLAGEPLRWRVEAAHVPANGSEALRWTGAEGEAAADPSGAAWNATFRARYGPGRYALTLVAEGDRLARAEASIEVEVPQVTTDGGAVAFRLDVPEEPTTLHLASDAVNADGKSKAPGNAVITRVVVADSNGLADVRRVTFAYFRDDPAGRVLVDLHAVEGLAGEQATVEDRFDRAPMKDAPYVCVVTAEGTGSPQVERTFVLTDTAPGASLALAPEAWRPATAGVLRGTLTVRDANFGTGPLDGSDITELEPLRVLAYKGSARVAEAGWTVAAGPAEGPPPLDLDLRAEGTRTTGFAYRAEDGKGALALPVEVRIPEGAAPGSYRLSVAANTTLASAPFEVLPLPRVAKLSVPGPGLPGGAVNVTVDLQPREGAVAVELRTPWGHVARAHPDELVALNATALRWNLTLPLPAPLDDDTAWEVTAVADLGDARVVLDPSGQPVNARTAALAVGNVAPRLQASLRVGGVAVGGEAWVHPHAAGELEAVARASDANAMRPDLADELAPLEVEVRDWHGNLTGWAVEGARDPAAAALRIAPPAGAERGRYTVRVVARDDDGATAGADLAVHLGTRFRLALRAPAGGLALERQPDGTLAGHVEVANLGNAPAASLAVLAEGLPPGTDPSVQLRLPNGTALGAPLAAGFARFGGPLLAPGEAATLVVRVASTTGVAAGTFAGTLRIAGEAL